MTRHAAVAAYSGPTCTYYGDEIGDKSGNGNADNKARTSGRISGFNQNEQMVHDYVAKVFKARAENPALWRGTVQRQEGTQYEIITKTDNQTGNKVVVIFSEIDTNISIANRTPINTNGAALFQGPPHFAFNASLSKQAPHQRNLREKSVVPTTLTKKFLALTGVNIALFDEILPWFEEEHNHYLRNHDITGKRRSGKRAGAIYANSPLPTVVAMPWTSPLQARREPKRRHAALRIYKKHPISHFGV